MMPPSIHKKIYYVWYGAMPEKISDCISGWKKIMPGYEIIDASGCFDLQKELERCRWLKTVYQRKLWAYVCDYVRTKVLLDNGGIFFDADITVVKPFDCFLCHEFFAGFESPDTVAVSIIGCLPNHPLMLDMYNFYQKDIWETSIFTQPQILTRLLTEKYGCILFDSRKFPEPVKFGSVTLYPEKYFYPYRYDEQYDESRVTDDTYAIHWWNGSWRKPEIYAWLTSKHLPGAADRPDTSSEKCSEAAPKRSGKPLRR
jgi:mannosyltransferase OCH1-like enzyme